MDMIDSPQAEPATTRRDQVPRTRTRGVSTWGSGITGTGVAARAAMAVTDLAIAAAFAYGAWHAWGLAIDLWDGGALFRRYAAWCMLPSNTVANAIPAGLKSGVPASAARALAAVPTGAVAALMTYSVAEGVFEAVARFSGNGPRAMARRG